MKQHQPKSALCNDEVRTSLESLHRRFVIARIHIAANSYALICKRFYVNRLFSEVGTFSYSNTKTY